MVHELFFVILERRLTITHATCRYPYPIMSVLSTSERAGLFSFSGILFTISSITLKWLYGCINGVQSMQMNAGRPLQKVE